MEQCALGTAPRHTLSASRSDSTFWFWLALLGLLAPVWCFAYVPTQDGEALLATALVLMKYDEPGSRFQEVYSVDARAVPNWASFALLGALCSVFPPLVAEKLLVSSYLLGIGLGYRYYCQSLGRISQWSVFPALILAHNQCFWLGFYNFCLSLVLYWFILGYVIRHLEHFRGGNAVVLCVLWFASFFTHLFGFAVCVASCFWLACAVIRRRPSAILWMVLASMPTVWLTFTFFRGAGYFGAAGLPRVARMMSEGDIGSERINRAMLDLSRYGERLLGPLTAGGQSLGGGIIVLFGAMAVLYLIFGRCVRPGQESRLRGVPVATLALAIFLLYLAVPDFFTFGKGGFLKSRLALFPPLLALSCCDESRWSLTRWFSRIATLVSFGVTLLHVWNYMEKQNHAIAEFTSAMDVVGKNRLIFFVKEDGSPRVDPLRHAVSYYCLDSGNIDLTNLFAATRHSPVRFRHRSAGRPSRFEAYHDPDIVDVILVWAGPHRDVPTGFRTTFQRGRLKVMERERRRL